MRQKLALLISVLFSPFLVIAIFSALVIYKHSHSLTQFFLWCAALVFFVILIPLVYIQYLVSRGKITDSHLSHRDERILPFAVALIGCVLLSAFYLAFQAPRALIAMAVSLIINGVAFMAITRYWKISMHASSFASSVVIISMLVNSNGFWLYLLLIPIFWARLFRQKHDIWQLAAGAFISSAITVTVLWLMNF